MHNTHDIFLALFTISSRLIFHTVSRFMAILILYVFQLGVFFFQTFPSKFTFNTLKYTTTSANFKSLLHSILPWAYMISHSHSYLHFLVYPLYFWMVFVIFMFSDKSNSFFFEKRNLSFGKDTHIRHTIIFLFEIVLQILVIEKWHFIQINRNTETERYPIRMSKSNRIKRPNPPIKPTSWPMFELNYRRIPVRWDDARYRY